MKQTSEQRECIWDIPEDKRHCEFCTANCNKVPTISTTYVLEEIRPEAFRASMGKIWDFLKRFKEYKEQKNKKK